MRNNKKKQSIKRVLSKMMIVILIVTMLPFVSVKQVYASYSSSWENWSQGASNYSGMRSYGCRVVAFAKLIKESGWANFADPDVFFEWGVGKNFFVKATAYENVEFGTPMINYIAAQGGYAKRVATVCLSDNVEEDKRKMMDYMNQGYYLILSCGAHTAFVGRSASINAGKPMILNSRNTNGQTGKVMEYTGRHDSYAKCDYSKYRVYYVSDGPNKPESTTGGGTEPPKESSISISGAQYPTGNLSIGQKFGIRGTIYSAYNLTNVIATIYNSAGGVVQQKSVVPNKTSYDLRNAINNAMVFNTLGTGRYRFVVSATDSKGMTKNVIDQGFSVGSVSMPVITTSNVAGGVQVSISAGCDVYYTLNGASPVGGTRYTGPFLLTNNATVKAVAEYYGAYSNVAERQVTASKLKTPTVASYIDTGAMTVTIEAEAGAATYYTTDGSEPTTASNLYVGAFKLANSATIKAVSIKSGYVNSSVGAADIVVTEPAVPKVSLSCDNKIAKGDAAKVVWDTQPIAYSYIVKLYKDGVVKEEQEVKGNSAVFTLTDAGEYQITVSAKNFKGTSSESYPPVKVTAMEPSSVTFTDYDDTVISSQEVKYGDTAELPVNPSRRGYNFNKWDNNAVYRPVTESFTAKATYTKKKYIVKFVDENGNTLATQQEVLFDEAVVLPPDPTTDRVGFSFMGWRCSSVDESSVLDYEHVDANMTLQAVFDWGNKDFPIIASITRANQNDANSYSIGVTLQNYPDEKTYARMIVSLKTSSGKMVKTMTQDVTLEKNELKTIDNIEMISDKVATLVEVNMIRLDGDKTCGAYADAVTKKTTSYSNTKWSDWSTSVPPAGLEKEEKTMWRYRDKIYTSSTSPSLDGWTQYGTPTVNYGSWGSTIATTSYPGTSDTLQITGSSTVYNYYHYCCNYYDGKNNVDSISYGSGKHYYHTLSTSSPLPTFSMADKGNRQPYGGKGKAAGCNCNFYAWFSNGSTTTYYYQTRSKTTTYYYYTWGNWSNYSDTYVASSGDRQVEQQTYYRYKINLETPTEGEDNSGTVYTQEGAIDGTDLDLNGRKANVLVYKSTNTDPTENQLEYVGQTLIGEGNTYSFTFVPKEEPDEAKSNYIVALALEGQTNLYNIDVISKTNPKYQVTFFDKEGNEISSCEVEEGQNAVLPEVPHVSGYTFIGWDKDTTNVEADRAITAMYKPNEYSVVYVDWENNFIEMMQLPYGAELPAPATELIEGKDFIGWDKLLEGATTVSDNSIISATYDTKTFHVQFVNGDGTVISDQEVEYGDSAKLPANIESGDKQFLGWSNENAWWKVTKDMTVEPILVYDKTAVTPVYAIEDTYLGGELTLDAGPNSRIYYAVEYEEEILNEEASTDEDIEDAENIAAETMTEDAVDVLSGETYAEDGNLTWQEYTDPILLYDDAVVYFYAEEEGQNASEIVDVEYTYKEVENPYVKTAGVSVPIAAVAPGEQIQVPVSLQSNPGVMGIGMTVTYDKNVFSDVSIEKGILFDNGFFDYNVDEEEGRIFIIWANSENVNDDGSMFTVNMTAAEDAEFGEYPLTISYEQEDTFNDNWTDVKLDIPNSVIRVGDIVYGDANQDGLINNKDVAYIACYLVDKVTLTEQGKAAADVNGDGRLDNKDVAKLARYLVGKEIMIGGK